MDEQTKAQYQYLINCLYGVINSVNNSKDSVKKLDAVTTEGMKINDKNPEADAVAGALNSMSRTTSNLYSAIYSMRQSMNK